MTPSPPWTTWRAGPSSWYTGHVAIPFTTITFSYSPPSGAIATGSVTATLTTPILDLTDKIVVPAGVYTGIVNAAGQGSLQVPQSDYSGFSTVPSYLFTQNVAGAGVPFWAPIPSTLGPVVDITQIAPSAPPPVPSAFNTANSWTALQTFIASLRVPGAAVGQVLGALDTQGDAGWINALLAANNLSDLASLSASRLTLGIDRQLLLPTGATAETFPREQISGTYMTGLVSGTTYCSAIGLPKGHVVNGMAVNVGNAAFTAVTHGWYALLDQTMTVRAVTTDQPGSWQGTFARVAFNFVSPYTIPANGVYYMTFCPSFTTSGSLSAMASAVGSMAGIPPVLAGTSSTGQSTPPSVGSTLAAIVNVVGDRFYSYTT